MTTITICSSIEFTPQIIEIKGELESLGFNVNIPYLTQKIIDGKITFKGFLAQKERDGGDLCFREADSLDYIMRYWDLISESSAILVLNESKKGEQYYIGGNTLIEMGFAYGHGKPIFLYNPVPNKSERIHYVDEILSMKPIVINGNVDKISEKLNQF